MFFGEVPIDESVGALLAHSHRSDRGRIRKGQALTPSHVQQLRAEGVSHVTVARLEPGDVHEDDAATEIATRLAAHNLNIGQASTGRVNLHAASDGLLTFEPEDIHALNAVDESITAATLSPESRVAAGQIVATIKIIPYAVRRGDLTQAVNSVQRGLSVHSRSPSSVGLIQTRLPSISESALDKTSHVTTLRLLDRQMQLRHERRTDHTVADVLRALRQSLESSPDIILLVGASAISDRSDVIPSAVEEAGGRIEHFGMPMDPGNLLLIGEIGTTTIIGMPGCARSNRYNGLDLVLNRLSCSLPIDRAWVTRLGVGGLLQEMIDRPRPRVIARDEPVVTALVLAAGSSTRFGPSNKLLATWHGTPLLTHVMAAIEDSLVESTTVVTGHQHAQVEPVVRGVASTRPVTVLYNDAHQTGMASSLIRGVSTLIDSDAIVVCLGDMPCIQSSTIDALIESFKKHPNKAIYIPTVRGQRGNPVLIARRLFDSILSLSGDTGARVLARQFPDSVLEVATDDPGIRLDVDATDDLQQLGQPGG